MLDRRGFEAFTLTEVMIVVVVIGLLAIIAVPAFSTARASAQKNTCIANLRTIDAAKQNWAVDNRKAATTTPTKANLLPYLPKNQMPDCPAGGTYSIHPIAKFPTCSMPKKENHEM